MESSPAAFFHVLKDCGALRVIFPEIDNLFGVPQPPKYHPEIDTGVHALLALEQAARLSNKPEVRFAALMHDLGKALSPKADLPHHYGHESAGLPLLAALCKRLRAPTTYQSLAMLVMRYHTHCHKIGELRPGTAVDLLTELGAFKPHHNTLPDFVLACEADAKGRTGLESQAYPQGAYLQTLADAALAVNMAGVLAQGLQGAAIGEAIRRLRIEAVAAIIKNNPYPTTAH
jgi:tRNA nucleotidyltransferase (CCA-adding enzyme)